MTKRHGPVLVATLAFGVAVCLIVACLLYFYLVRFRVHPASRERYEACSRPEKRWAPRWDNGRPPLWIWYDPGKGDNGARVAGHPGDDPNPLIRECWESVLRHNNESFDIRLVGSAAVAKIVDVPQYFFALPYNHRSDFGSVLLLERFGGAYLDFDVLVLTPLAPYLRLLEAFEAAVFGTEFEPGEAGYNEHGMIFARPESEWTHRVHAQVLLDLKLRAGCEGATCTELEKLDEHGTLQAFWKPASAMVQAEPCSFVRLPASTGYNPGGWDRDHCHEAAHDLVLGTIGRVETRVLRAVHMSQTKYKDDVRAGDFAACPLLQYLVHFSRQDGLAPALKAALVDLHEMVEFGSERTKEAQEAGQKIAWQLGVRPGHALTPESRHPDA